MQRKRFGRPCAERIEHNVKSDEILFRKSKQIFYDFLGRRIDFVLRVTDKTRHRISARERFLYQKPSLFPCRTYYCYLFHDVASKNLICCNLLDYINSITRIYCNVKCYNKLFSFL